MLYIGPLSIVTGAEVHIFMRLIYGQTRTGQIDKVDITKNNKNIKGPLEPRIDPFHQDILYCHL